MVALNRFAVPGTGAKFVSIIASLASIASFAFTIADRTSGLPARSGFSGLNVVLHLALLTAIAFGGLWTIAEKLSGWSWGAGGGDTPPAGWAAVVMSLCMTLPLTFVPFAYQRITRVNLLLPLHWEAMLLVSLLCAGVHLLIFGWSRDVPGLRQRIAPTHPDTKWEAGLEVEGIFTVSIIGLMVLPYRLIVDPTEPLLRLGLGRILFPCLVYFSGMVVFTFLKYPGSLTDPRTVEIRGIVAGLLLMFCLCGGMFL